MTGRSALTALALLALAAHVSARAATSGPSIVLVGLGAGQCNAASELNLGAPTTLLAGDENLLDSPAACCSACKLRADCNVWTFCTKPEGCDSGGRYRECTLKQDSTVQKYQRVISRGSGWVSGYISTRCPGTDPKKLLSLQRINFPSLSGPCQPGSSCTACMCEMSKAMAIAKSEPSDLSLCISNFRTVLMFPTSLGGSSLSTAAYQRLSQCPIADPPCADQKSSVVFGTLGPALVPSNPGTTLTCLTGKKERDCAAACLATSGCDGFTYSALASPTRCCLQSGPSRDAKLSPQGDQQWYRMSPGTTAEDPFFTSSSPWRGSSATASTSTPSVVAAPASSSTTTTSAPSIAAAVQPATGSTSSAPSIAAAPGASSASCVQTACGDVPAPGRWSCAQQAAWNKCSEPWMAGFCNQTCQRCPCQSAPARTAPLTLDGFFDTPASSSPAPPSSAPAPSPSSPSISSPSCTCTDIQPGKHSCSEEARWGKCKARFMKPTKDVPQGYCAASCGRCSC